MAKKKTAKKAPAGKKPSNKKAASTKSSSRGSSLGPSPIGTGSGTPARDIGVDVCAWVNGGQPDATLWDKHWSKQVESIEGIGLVWKGRPAMEAKGQEWMKTHTVHGASAEGPYVGSTGFAVKFKMDVTDTTTGQRTLMEEIAVYTVKNGKVIREEFMYGNM